MSQTATNAKQLFKITQHQIAARAGVAQYKVCRHLQGVKLHNQQQAAAIDKAIDELTDEMVQKLAIARAKQNN